ncbi:response regulator [Geotalea uraniireducens]|uniref:Response regulator n=1 Tax=Geotalea uraniireducens TaxID=351604 RepID=A0ABM8EGC0_9BACT|nr:response regulator [Geotalea uraniireducens]BDV41443.1 response regulator [Geotalea uraniireducens]
MEGFATLTSVVDNAFKQAAEDSGMLLGQELTIGEADRIATNRQTYFCDMDDLCFVAEITSSGEFAGKFYTVIGLRDAICMSGYLLGIPPARINEKRRLAIMEDDDVDAFSEIVNQVVGSFNSIFQPAFTNKVHLKVAPPQKFIPETTEITETEPVPDSEYLLFRGRMEMAGQEMGYLDLLIPAPLAELFDPPEVVEEEPAAVAVESDAESEAAPGADDGADESDVTAGEEAAVTVSQAASSRKVLILEDDDGDRQLLREFLASRGYEPIEAGLDADIREILATGGVRLVVLGIHNGDDRDMAVCIKIKSLTQEEALPIIMCAREWTRSAVLKAVKYGARDIIVKPYQPEDVAAKVEKFLRAA